MEEMNIRPCGGQRICPACGKPRNDEFFVRSCSNIHLRGGVQNWIDNMELTAERKVHVHVQCPRCSFTWLEDVYDPGRIKEVW